MVESAWVFVVVVVVLPHFPHITVSPSLPTDPFVLYFYRISQSPRTLMGYFFFLLGFIGANLPASEKPPH